jgi:hypothetical protein
LRSIKKAGSEEPAFSLKPRAYFFSSGFDSLGDEGVVPIGLVDELELDEAAPPVAPVAPGVVVVLSAPVAGEGDGAVVDGAAGAVAGGGVTTFSSFLLQAVRPTASMAAMRSERFMVFPLGDITRFLPKTNGV